MDIGFIKLHRKMKEWEWYRDVPVKTLFLHFLLCANYDDKSWCGVDVKRGQVVTGRLRLSEETGLTEQQIRTALVKLTKTGEIAQQSTSKYTIITICNYEKYQLSASDGQPAINQQSTSNQPAINQQSTTTKEVKKLRSKERKKETFIDSPAWLPEKEWAAYLAMRAKIKKPMTDDAVVIAFKTLKGLMESGHQPADVLSQSVFNSWQGLFPIKDRGVLSLSGANNGKQGKLIELPKHTGTSIIPDW